MRDKFGREITYLRISVTDRCNLRCIYCMPEHGVEPVSHDEILSFDEILRVCTICAKQGISRIKLTGGEPLTRKGVSELLKSIRQIQGIEQVTLTTNAVLLPEQIESLANAGLDAVNISLNTLDQQQYRSITRRDLSEQAMAGVRAALSYPAIKVKINCVVVKGINEEQTVPLAVLAKQNPLDVRFIEMMPIGLGKSTEGCGQKEVCERLEREFGKAKFLSGKFGNGPAVYAAYPGFVGKVGFISAISHQFCGSCNRIRLSAEGFLKPCLQYATGVDLKGMMRQGKGEQQLTDIIRQVIMEKPCSHQFVRPQFLQTEGRIQNRNDVLEQKQMSRIGG